MGIGGRMREAAEQLTRLQFGQALATEQAVIDSLQRLGAALMPQLSQQSATEKNNLKGPEPDTAPVDAGGNPRPGVPSGRADRAQPDPAQRPERKNVHDLVSRMWGHLPDKLRDQMRATLREQFLPKYERVIEDYYLRLAEEQAARP